MINRKVKLALDIVMGAVTPILILSNFNEPLGVVPTYLLAALVPIAWVLLDICFITRRFNYITSYTGAFAILRGLLALWFVDGVQFALKDSIGAIFTVIVFGGSIRLRKPVMYYFLMQGMNPDSQEREQALSALLAESKVYGALVKSTRIVLMINFVIGITNFFLNLKIVVADFGTTAFNQQVAQVNAITHIAFTVLDLLGAGIATVLIRRAMFYYLPKAHGNEHDESDFWDLLNRRDRQRIAPHS